VSASAASKLELAGEGAIRSVALPAPAPGHPGKILRSLARHLRRRSQDEQEWARQYDEAMQWRDWQTCDYLLEELESAPWYRKEADRRA